MLKFKAIVCDDEEDKFERLSEMLGNDIFEYSYVKEFDALPDILALANFDVLFLDLYFGIDKQNFKIISYNDLENIRNLISKKKKLIVYTKHTSDEIILLRKAALSGIIDEWIDEQDLYDDSSKKDETIIRINKVVGVHNREQSILSIYHFSDLHFGKQYSFLDEPIGDFLIEQIKDQIEIIHNNESMLDIEIPKLVALSGDFTHTCSVDKLEEACAFLGDLEGMLEEYGISSPITALSLGNHDFNYDDSIVQEHKIVCGKTNTITERGICDEEYLKNLKWFRFQRTFEKIIDKFSTNKNFPRWIYYNYTDRLGLKIFSINTAFEMTYKNSEIKVNRQSLDELYQIVKKDKPSIGVLLCHHPLIEWGDEKTVEDLKRFLYNKLRIRVILSGHRHSNNIIPHRLEMNKYIYEIRTGSLAVAEGEMGVFKLPSYRILKFFKDNQENWTRLKSFTFEYRDGNYRPRTDEKGVYEEEIKLDSL